MAEEEIRDPICGLEYETIDEIDADEEVILKQLGYNFTALPLAEISKDDQFCPIKMFKYDLSWNTKVLGVVPDCIDVDSKDEVKRKASELYMEKVFKLAIYTGVTAIMINLKNKNNTNLARLCAYHLFNSHGRSMWFRVKIDEDAPEAWHRWNTFLSILPSCQNLCGCVLELGKTLPPSEQMKRWQGEIVSAISIPTSGFVSNASGYPVLRRNVQDFIIDFFKFKTQVIIHGPDMHGKGLQVYQQYINHLYDKRPNWTLYEEFSAGYEDKLQIPLQPLKDDLDNGTYEIFERDPIKYVQYEQAVYRALLDRGSPTPGEDPKRQVIMVVGAGRGPLIKASINATKRSKIPTKIYGVEKNEAALIVLRNLIEKAAFKDVTIVEHDMRTWEPPEKADIIVSELLGSWSDNELSPECLDGAQRLLKEDGISIPCKYTSYIAPLSSRKLYNSVGIQGKEHPKEDNYHMAYVVRVHNANVFDRPKACFTFEHPNYSTPMDNSRHIQLEFSPNVDVVMHGMVGYFDAQLYKDVMISIHPDTHSKDMFSWFPMFFPLKNPIMVKEKEKIKLDFWRIVDASQIWYEWVVSEPQPQGIHNSRGVTYWIGLYP